MTEMKIYHVETQQAYDALMIELEEKGCIWMGGENPTHFDGFKRFDKDTYVYDEHGVIQVSSEEYFKEHYSDETPIEYKADKQKECKQCHKKWHHTNAKYCAMCGNKLVDEPEFKAGDIVSSEILPDGIGIVRLEEDLTYELSEIYGIWYTNNDHEIQEVAFVIFKEDTRHATPEEIAEYESALQFHKHGRKPFEVRIGDLIRNKSDGKNFLVKGDTIFLRKQDFIDGKLFFKKTYKEVSEWLENK